MYKQITLATAGLCFALATAAQTDSVRNTVSGRAYAIVTIGTQTWTAENIADSVYDSQNGSLQGIYIVKTTKVVVKIAVP